jgi:hypothetical protein
MSRKERQLLREQEHLLAQIEQQKQQDLKRVE